ncbi:MAG: hypothetical protein ACM3X9_05350 [Bacillota bacterium]
MKGREIMPDLKAEDIKETVETQTKEEADKYVALGWLLIDTYKMNDKTFYMVAWTKNDPPVKP